MSSAAGIRSSCPPPPNRRWRRHDLPRFVPLSKIRVRTRTSVAFSERSRLTTDFSRLQEGKNSHDSHVDPRFSVSTGIHVRKSKLAIHRSLMAFDSTLRNREALSHGHIRKAFGDGLENLTFARRQLLHRIIEPLTGDKISDQRLVDPYVASDYRSHGFDQRVHVLETLLELVADRCTQRDELFSPRDYGVMGERQDRNTGVTSAYLPCGVETGIEFSFCICIKQGHLNVQSDNVRGVGVD